MTSPKKAVKYLTETVYVYIEPGNAEWARTYGREIFGSTSAYINTLIANDRGIKPHLGFWKTKGEAEQQRLAK